MYRFLLILAAVMLLCSCGPREERQEPVDENLPIVESLLDSMTVEQKVAQLFVVAIEHNDGPKDFALQDSLVRMGLGGIIIMKGPVGPFIERANQMQEASEIPLLECTDAEWGAGMRFDEYLPYPRQYQIGRIPDATDLLYRMGQNVAEELKALNIYVNFAPVSDLNFVNPQKGARRSFGLSAEKTAQYCTAYMKGMQDGGIYACGKHFPGRVEHQVDSHISMPVFTHSREYMDSVVLVPFKSLIKEGVGFIMMGHYCIPAVDSSMVPMSISRKCVTGLLKEELGFDGLVITDALGMGGVANGRTPLEVNLAAYGAGVDMLLMARDVPRSIRAITDSVSCGAFSVEDLDRRVRKILTFKAKAGFFDEGYSPVVEDLEAKIAVAAAKDSALIAEMNAAIRDAVSAPVEKVTADPTLQMIGK